MDAYNVEKRQKEKAATATVNRELALLRRAFSIGFDAEPQKVTRVPKFHKHMVSEKGNERRGFIEEHQYRKLADAAAGKLWLRTLLALAYTYGLRRGELLGNPKKDYEGRMRSSQVDLLNNTVTLYSGETKNDDGRHRGAYRGVPATSHRIAPRKAGRGFSIHLAEWRAHHRLP